MAELFRRRGKKKKRLPSTFLIAALTRFETNIRVQDGERRLMHQLEPQDVTNCLSRQQICVSQIHRFTLNVMDIERLVFSACRHFLFAGSFLSVESILQIWEKFPLACH